MIVTFCLLVLVQVEKVGKFITQPVYFGFLPGLFCLLESFTYLRTTYVLKRPQWENSTTEQKKKTALMKYVSVEITWFCFNILPPRQLQIVCFLLHFHNAEDQ